MCFWEYSRPPGELQEAKEGRAIATSDGGPLVFTGQRVEVYVNPVTGQLRWHNHVFKLTPADRRNGGAGEGSAAVYFSQQSTYIRYRNAGWQRLRRLPAT